MTKITKEKAQKITLLLKEIINLNLNQQIFSFCEIEEILLTTSKIIIKKKDSFDFDVSYLMRNTL